MYQTNFSSEKQNLTNGDSKLNKNKFTKSLTSFHTKKNMSKNISSQNPPKKPGQIKQDKSVKNKRVYLSSKKVKALNYLKLNQISPDNNILYDLNKQEIETNQQNKVYNAPSSVQRSYKYKNCYILNNLNNYQPNVIPGEIIQSNQNKYTEIKLSESAENNENIIDNNNNNSNSYTISENRKTNGASSNINDNNENNSVFQPSSVNGLNTITFNINNNYNNCYNNYNSNIDEKGFNQSNGYMNVNGFNSMVNKSVSNSNEYLTINSREKIINKLEESDKDNYKNINIVLGNENKVINNKRSNLFKGKSNNKIKSKQALYSNTINAYSVTNFNNEKKNFKPTVLSEKNESNDAQNYVYETVDNAINTNLVRTKNKYKFNNKMININNQRNFDYKNGEMENTKSMNNTGSALKIQKEKNYDNYLDNKIKEQNNDDNKYQIYGGSFKNNKNMIKVNMIESKKNNINDNEDNVQYLNKPKLGFKNNNKSTNNLKTSLDKSENKNIFGCKKYNKKNNSQSNKKININNSNKAKFNDKNKINKNNLIQTYNNFQKEDENIYEKEDINQTNYNEQNYKNDLQTKSVNCLDCYTKKSNIIPLTRENSITYIRKKSLNMKVYKNDDNNNNNFMSSRPSTFKHKKTYSISSSVYNSQRYLNEVKIDLKNNKNSKKNIVYTPKNNVNNINEKTIVIPEYQIKLENIKSRINNLLNIYSLLALKSLNVPNGDDKSNQDNLDNN